MATDTFLSTLSLRRATLTNVVSSVGTIGVFYPRSPCGERHVVSSVGTIGKSFLSTLSLRRATRRSSGTRRRFRFFYPRSPCGERHTSGIVVPPKADFLSTLSLRRATTWQRGSRVTYVFSIHALLAESDPIQANILKL